MMKYKASTQLSISVSIIVIIAGLCSILALNWQMKNHAQQEAKEKARILLDRNLATHTYFSHQLKPSLFKKMESFVEESYFEPAWMSSTYAVREIDKYYHEIEETEYYYKEAAINARSPENEADAFERGFIEELNKSSEIVRFVCNSIVVCFRIIHLPKQPLGIHTFEQYPNQGNGRLKKSGISR
ncbi:MAG: DUF3365 domain-containing protein [Desulfobacterales bacterium]|nr:DUF3365 domain-containing protein [Desulfobacterales bacterium]